MSDYSEMTEDEMSDYSEMTDEELNELKDCPFCGGNEFTLSNVTIPLFVFDRIQIQCVGCRATLFGYSIDETYHDWNTRTIEDELRAEIARRDEELALTEKKLCNIDRSARVEIARRDEELKITDGLLKEATETIGAVVACCTYNSNDDAKIGIYGIDQKAFTRIDQFITHYNDAVSAGKVSVDVKPVKRENDYQNDNRTNTGG